MRQTAEGDGGDHLITVLMVVLIMITTTAVARGIVGGEVMRCARFGGKGRGEGLMGKKKEYKVEFIGIWMIPFSLLSFLPLCLKTSFIRHRHWQDSTSSSIIIRRAILVFFPMT